MTDTALAKLLEVLGPPLGPTVDNDGAVARLTRLSSEAAPAAVQSLAGVLAARNGAFGFENALMLLSLGGDPAHDLATWNGPSAWRSAYGDLARGLLVFAFDGFGGAFVLDRRGVGVFDPETGQVERLAHDLEGWAQALLDDYEVLTGHPLVRAWQQRHGPLELGQRLEPVRPFVLGGAFTVTNLRSARLDESLLRRAQFASATRHLPDGARLSAPGPSDPKPKA